MVSTCHGWYMSWLVHVTVGTCHGWYMSRLVHVTVGTCHGWYMSRLVHVTVGTCHGWGFVTIYVQLSPGSQYDNTRICVVFVASVVLGNTQLDQGFI